MNPISFETFFNSATKGNDPYDYQCRLACGERNNRSESEWLTGGAACNSQLINIPTGLGKTAAVVLAWLWNRVHLHNAKRPRHRCLPANEDSFR